MADEDRFAKGDLNSVMAAYPHVADWVRDFESRYGSRPMYYGPLDRDAKKNRPFNLIYLAKEPIFILVILSEVFITILRIQSERL